MALVDLLAGFFMRLSFEMQLAALGLPLLLALIGTTHAITLSAGRRAQTRASVEEVKARIDALTLELEIRTKAKHAPISMAERKPVRRKRDKRVPAARNRLFHATNRRRA